MLKVRKYGWGDFVWRCTELGFGDTWAVTNYLLRISEEINKPTRVFSNSKSFIANVKEIKNYIDSYGDIEFVNKTPNARMSYCEPYRIKFLPTKKTWQQKTNIVAYQFDGRHLADIKKINHEQLLRKLKSKGYLPINLGGFKPLDFVINVLAKCRFFVGCPSGISVVALSVRTPVCVITGNLPIAYLRFMKNCQYYNGVQMFRYERSFLQTVEF